MYYHTNILDFQSDYQLWANEKKKLVTTYDRFVKAVTKFQKKDGNNFFEYSKFKLLTYYEDNTNDNDEDEDMVVDDDDMILDDDDFEDMPGEVIFSPEFSILFKTLDVNRGLKSTHHENARSPIKF